MLSVYYWRSTAFSSSSTRRNLSGDMEEIRRGAYSVVCRETLARRLVIVKTFKRTLPEVSECEEDWLQKLQKFKQECDRMMTIKHPNVAKIIQLSVRENQMSLIVEHINQTLDQYLLKNRGQLETCKQRKICIDVTSGLLFLHEQAVSIVHGNLTPKNVLLGEECQTVKITDVGHARCFASVLNKFSEERQRDVPYLAPELFSEGAEFSTACDVFSLGVVMLETTTQEPPTVESKTIGTKPELHRRMLDLAKLPGAHPYEKLFMTCFRDNPTMRPTTREVLLRLRILSALDFGDDTNLRNIEGRSCGQAMSLNLPNMLIPTAGCTVLRLGKAIFVLGGICQDEQSNRKIQYFCLEHFVWKVLPQLAPQYCSQADTVGGLLTLIGGRDSDTHRITSKLHSYDNDGWKEIYPPMPTCRSRPGITQREDLLIVSGGRSIEGITLGTIDVLSVTSKQWSSPGGGLTLPRPLQNQQLISCGFALYAVNGGFKDDHQKKTSKFFPVKMGWKISWANAKENVANCEHTHACWSKLPGESRNWASSSFASTNLIFSVGGFNGDCKAQSRIEAYSPTDHKRYYIGECKEKRIRPGTMYLGEDTFLVVGGYQQYSNWKRSLQSSVELVYIN